MEVATQASLDWKVLELPVAILMPDGIFNPIADQKALVRSDTQRNLGIVSKKYEVVQNSVLTNLVQPLVSEGLLEVVNTGYLRGGRKVFIQAQMTAEFEIVGEQHRGMLTLLNSHDGTTKLSAGVTDVRVICQNTFAMAYSEMSTRLQHKLGVNQKALSITETVNYVNERMFKFQEAAQTLAKAKATPGSVEKMIREAFGKTESEEFRQRDEIMGLFERGAGNSGKTLWDAFNAITEYNTHKSRRDPGGKFAYANFGTGAAVARKAIDAALALV